VHGQRRLLIKKGIYEGALRRQEWYEQEIVVAAVITEFMRESV
ncbi:hypothetical protein A2U01_0078897, partial [Trifolium medium]|nr:hypothetical protein [Trifolium medium]